MTFYLNELVDHSGPSRFTTMVIDRISHPAELLSYSTWNEKIVVKIGWGLPFIIDEKALIDRIHRFRESGFHVSNGGTALEIAYSKGRLDDVLFKFKQIGFDTVEMSEGILEMPASVKEQISDFAHSNDLGLHVEIGRKNPRNQLSLDETVSRLKESMDFDPDILIVEGRETGKGVEIYDSEGGIKWDWVNRIIKDTDKRMIMFEAPLEFQQAQFVLKLGSDVNLGNISMGSFYALKTQRLGLRGDTFGAFREPIKKRIPPSARFVAYVLATHGPMEQKTIMALTGLNRRTVQNSLELLIKVGEVTVSHDFRDMRKKLYMVSMENGT